MLRFWKLTLGNLKTGKFPFTLNNLKFLGIISDEICLFEKNCFFQGIYHEKIESRAKMPAVLNRIKAQKSRIKQQIDDLILLKVNVCS